MHIALAADQHMLPGLHVTLYSLLACTSADVHIHLVHEGINDKRISRIQNTVTRVGKCRLHDIPFEKLGVPEGPASIHGSRLCFSLLVLPKFLGVGRFIWIDSDLIVTKDIEPLSNVSFKEPIAAVSHVKTRNVLPKWRAALHDAGIDESRPHFNTGVCVINTEEWGGLNVTRRAFEAETEYRIGGDQPLLNIASEFHEISGTWNRPCYRSGEPANLLSSDVWHLVGSPKPWDLGGWLHSSYSAFRHVLEHTGYRHEYTVSQFTRAGRLARSYGSLLKELYEA